MDSAEMRAAANARALKLRLSNTLDELPAGPVRESFVGLLRDIVDLVHDPACAGRQGDGVPCANANQDCEACRKVSTLLDSLRSRLADDRG